ncbi:signal recognition particle-docking protein FtsY [Enterobacteriaceae endosymbiont of Donacia sparganii]|uniref:signal recognition particle-docking protein FtsY n=1 Tax=Enterobacteriaceae endosymbiont of Donacia sparganii TaxID=2675785 RepID=UPI001449202A|nr:signal recognition particle-docking protein FtsY [Enterobacteriaceae endosymbiont of Donacia sparganii]QJC35523.1 signal recognition particle-docking protein FtsY [Enterobacteriaceae endosymbiont of Donacia sparganii]
MINKENINKKNEKKISFFNYFKKKLIKTSKNIGKEIINLFKKKKFIDEKLFNNLKEKLIISDVGIHTANKIINLTKKYAKLNKLENSSQLYEYLKIEMLKILLPVEVPLVINNKKKPFIILIIGVNGVGKTTTIGKLAYYFYKKKKSVLLASGDTFRAGAHEQLNVWSKKSNSFFVYNKKKKDSSAIIFDAISQAKKKQIDILIADTSGRLHNNFFLMEELKKIVRVIKKNNNMVLDEIMLVLDANIGQNSINQLKIFHENIGVTGIIISKIDGTAKGGVIFSLANEFNIPIRYLGSGEKITDLYTFNAKDFINAIFTNY